MGAISGSPNLNERHDTFSDLLPSMHSLKTYIGALSDAVLLDKGADQTVQAARKMRAGGEARQERLKPILRVDKETASKGDKRNLMRPCERLQFFDTPALYFNPIFEGVREKAVFPHVPVFADLDLNITLLSMSEDRCEVSPWPFEGESLRVSFRGWYMQQATTGTKTASEVSDLPLEKQVMALSASR